MLAVVAELLRLGCYCCLRRGRDGRKKTLTLFKLANYRAEQVCVSGTSAHTRSLVGGFLPCLHFGWLPRDRVPAEEGLLLLVELHVPPREPLHLQELADAAGPPELVAAGGDAHAPLGGQARLGRLQHLRRKRSRRSIEEQRPLKWERRASEQAPRRRRCNGYAQRMDRHAGGHAGGG